MQVHHRPTSVGWVRRRRRAHTVATSVEPLARRVGTPASGNLVMNMTEAQQAGMMNVTGRTGGGSRPMAMLRAMEARRKCLGYDIVPTRVIGEGDFGTVWGLHDDDAKSASGKRWILKVSRLGGDPEEIESFNRETYFLKRLQGSGLVPELKTAVRCNDEGLQVMERFDGSLQDLGAHQAQRWDLPRGDKVLTVEQLSAVVELVLKLEGQRVYHGDLKRGNILYSISPGGHFRAVVADFGFSGAPDSPYYPLTGFTRNYHCPSGTVVDKHGYTKLQEPIPKYLLPYINRLQIYTDFIGGRRTYIVSKNGTKISPISARRLAKALDIPKHILTKYKLYCPDVHLPF